jgi:NAD(P)-dependent dehydrogenase (short-subunit alcohol dehydrogenase family)
MKWPEELNFMINSRKKQKTTNESMRGKRCVVSGCTSGVGLMTIKELAKVGADIVMVIRNKQKALPIQTEIEATYHVKVDIVIADFSDLDSVRSAAKIINDTYPKIDVLINSAGIHSTKKKYNKDGYEMVFCVNHLATFLFTMLLLDLLKKSAPSRIIQVNSEGHRFNGLRTHDLNWKKRIYTGLRGYGASKTAQLMTVWKLSEMLEKTGVTINAVHPGAVKSRIGSNNGFLYRAFSKLFIYPFLKKTKVASDAMYYHAASKEMENVSGKFYNLTIEEIPAKHARNKEKTEIIWEKTMEMVDL